MKVSFLEKKYRTGLFILVISSALLFVSASTFSQEIKIPEIDKASEKARIDYAVPSAPASTILGLEQDIILKPGSIREIAVSVQNLLEGGGALEIAPGMLLGKQDLYKYINDSWYRFVNRARISFASKQSTTGERELGLGLRFTLYDETDMRTNDTYTQLLVNKLHVYNEIIKQCALELKIDEFNMTETDNIVIDECASKRVDMKIEEMRDSVKMNNWNKTIIELGIAVAAFSTDSVLKNYSLAKHGLWVTGGFPLFGDDVQLLINLHTNIQRNQLQQWTEWEMNGVFRGYYGSNSAKGFLEGDFIGKYQHELAFGIATGFELNVLNGVWVEGSLHWQKEEQQEDVLTTSFNVRFATPEWNF
ncbi:MAG: hypothetical protein HY960_10595 [Ignavibacteriae bacterium]|nr:hypothetical protein [Ignavibacteriota bacterium]